MIYVFFEQIILIFVFERNKVHVVDFRDGLRMICGQAKIFINHLKKTEKMKTEKLSLDAFKEMANNVQSKDILMKIGGGTAAPVQSDCHGIWGGFQKYLEMPKI